MSEMIERVAKAIDAASKPLFTRFNDWTSDRVEGLPIEVCRHGVGDEPEIVVLARYPGLKGERNALQEVLLPLRARAAIQAMQEPTGAMTGEGFRALFGSGCDKLAADCWRAMIDEALK